MNGQLENLVEQEKFSAKKTIGFAAYSAASTANGLLVSYLTYYATDSLLLAAAAIGMILAFSRVFDGITDIIAGAIVDRTNTKIGRARPYILCGAVAYIFMIAMFATPDISNTGKLVWIFITYNLNSSIFQTIYAICGPTLLKRMVVNSDSRVKLLAINNIAISLASAGINIVLPIMVAKAAGSAKNWTYLALGMGSIAIILILIAFFCCKEYTAEELVEMGVLKDQDAVKQKKTTIKEMLISIVKNKYFLIYLVVFFVNALYMGISYGVQVYYYATNLGNVALMSTVSMIMLLTLPLNLVYSKIVQKIGSAKFVKYFLVVGAVGSVLRMFAGANVVGLAVTSFLSGFVISGISLVGTEITIQCMEYSYLKNGIQAESIYNSFLNFGMKVGMGVGAAILGVVLTSAGYDGALAAQPDSAVSAINFMFNIFPAICAAIMFIGCNFLKVEEANKKLRDEA